MKWEDARITENVTDELSDLKSVIEIVSQMPKNSANRILAYCHSFVNRDQNELPPSGEKEVSSMMEALKGSILKNAKES